MSHTAHKFSRKLKAIGGAGLFLAATVFSMPAQAWDDHYRTECREVVKKFQVSRSVTYTERGTACEDRYGNWNLTTNTRFPSYRGEVFFVDRGRLIFVGNLYPSYSYKKKSHSFKVRDIGYREPPNCDRRDWHDHDDHDHDRRDYDWRDNGPWHGHR